MGPNERIIPIRISMIIPRYDEYSIPNTVAKSFADEAAIPGQIQGINVERINQIGAIIFNFLAKPTKTLSPVTSVYLSISVFRKNCKVIPIQAPQMIPRP